MPVPTPTPIYHITLLDNLASILAQGGLWSDAEMVQRKLVCKGIAYSSLKSRRAKYPVQNRSGQPVALGGVLADYVPFYFARRTPMLGAIHKKLTDYKGGQQGVIYLVSSVQSVIPHAQSWCFTDGHAVEALTDYFDNVAQLGKVDWSAVDTWRWKPANDPDCLRRKQAEFLVHKFFTWNWVQGIAVIDNSIASQVAAIIAGATHKPPIRIQSKWYFQ